MVHSFKSYPKILGAKHTDKNIDHRWVLNIKTYFKRQGYALSLTKNAKDYRAGDIVTCKVQDYGGEFQADKRGCSLIGWEYEKIIVCLSIL